MERTPQTKQRSKWRDLIADDPVTSRTIIEALEGIGAQNIELWHRNVGDGVLRVIVDEEPMGWHLSISHAKRGKGGQLSAGRYPKWDEIADARYSMLPEDIDVVMHLPPPDEYVALHDTTFHLHEYPDRDYEPQIPVEIQRPSGLLLPPGARG